MRNLLYFALLGLLFACNSKPVELNIMTFNIRYDNPADSLNNWQYRKDVASEVLKAHNIDIVGTQEVLYNQLNDLKEHLPEYNALGVGREDGKTKGEYSAILYKKDKFTEEETGYFWLSETPEVAGSKGWDGACERIATWVILKHNETGKKLFFLNTHLDHIGKIARQEGVTLILNRAKELSKGLPVIITGDFNAEPETNVIKHVTESGFLKDSKNIAKTVNAQATGTFHAFGKVPEEKRTYIDYIFVNDKIQIEKYEVLPEKMNNVFVSDHVPVFAKVIL